MNVTKHITSANMEWGMRCYVIGTVLAKTYMRRFAQLGTIYTIQKNENNHTGVLIVVKFRLQPATLLKVTLLYGWVFFTFSKMYNGTKSCKASRTCSLLWINPLLPNAPFQSPWKHKRAFLQKSLTAVNYFRKKVFWYFQGDQKGKFERKELTNVLILNQWRQYETYLGLQ